MNVCVYFTFLTLLSVKYCSKPMKVILTSLEEPPSATQICILLSLPGK